MNNLDRKALLAKWLIIIWLASIVPLPFYSPELKGAAPLLLLMLIALGTTAGYPAHMTFEMIALPVGYSVLLYWVAGRFSRLLLSAETRRKQFILLMASGISLILVLSPIYAVGDKKLKFRNFYSFVERELFVVGAISYDHAPRPPTREELLALPDTIIHEDIAIAFSEPHRITQKRDKRIREVEKYEGIRVDRPRLAWWLRIKFIPMRETLRGIPAASISPTWRRVSEQRRGVIPEHLLRGELTGAMAGLDTWNPDFSVTGDFNFDGIEDVALAGIYEDHNGELGNFILILTRNPEGQWTKAFLSSQSGNLGPTDVSWGGREIHVSDCTGCDHSADVRWDKQTSTYTYNNNVPSTD